MHFYFYYYSLITDFSVVVIGKKKTRYNRDRSVYVIYNSIAFVTLPGKARAWRWSYHDNDDANDFFGGIADSRFIFMVSRAF